MTVSRALVSFTTAVTDASFRLDHLKLCYLWYDEVLFETIGQYEESAFFGRLLGGESNARKTIKELTDTILPLSRRVSADLIGKRFRIPPEGYPRWGPRHENYTYPDPENAEQYAHNCLLHAIEAECGVPKLNDGYAIEQAEGRARVAVKAVELWERINAEVECMLQAGDDEKLAMMAARQFSAASDEAPTPFSLFSVVVPSLSAVPWQQVVRLRRQTGFSSLREKIAEGVRLAGTDLQSAKQFFDKLEEETVNRVIEMGRPKVLKVAIESIIANLPGLAINPYGVYVGIRDTVSAIRKRKDFSWLYLLRDVRSAAQHADPTAGMPLG